MKKPHKNTKPKFPKRGRPLQSQPEIEDLFGDYEAPFQLTDEDRAWLNRVPVGQEIFWRDEVLEAPLPDALRDLHLTDIEAIYTLSLMDRVKIIRAGIPALALIALVKQLGRSFTNYLKALGLVPEDIICKEREGQRLDARETEQALGLARLIGQAALLWRGTDIDVCNWMGAWLVTWHPALDLAPIDFLSNQTGQALIESLLAEAA